MSKSSSGITAKELEKLNTAGNAAIAYRGKVYDVTAFLDKHPGGVDQLLLAAGRDVTHLFDSYHGEKTRKLIAKKCKYVGEFSEADSTANPKFLEDNAFYTTLERKVTDYFKSNQIDPKIHIPFFCASAAVVLATLACWLLAVVSAYNGYPLVVSSLLALASGFFSSLVAFHSHDIFHFAWTHNPQVWRLVGGVYCSVHGLSSYIWCYQHVIGHHIHPNHNQLDPAMATKKVDFWRIKPYQDSAPHYRHQALYMPFLFGFLSIKMKLQDFRSLHTLKKVGVSINPPSSVQLFAFVVTKALHVFYRLLLPAAFISMPTLLLLNLLSEFVMGLWVGLVSVINHVNTDAVVPDPDSASFGVTWSEMQILTAVDYATDSTFLNFITGGSNCQVMHHLFPWVLSMHNRDLSPLLEQTCAEFGYKYTCYGSPWEVLSSHIHYLRKMGEIPSTDSDGGGRSRKTE